MKTIQLTVIVDDVARPMAERVVVGAIKGIIPSIRRQAVNVEYEVYDGACWAADEESEEQR